MAGGLQNWAPYKTHVQGGLKEGNFLNGQFVLICAGPPSSQTSLSQKLERVLMVLWFTLSD